MATESSDQPKAPETISGEVQNKVLERCDTAGMSADQLLILHNVLRNFDTPESSVGTESWEVIDGQTREGQQKIADIFGPR